MCKIVPFVWLHRKKIGVDGCDGERQEGEKTGARDATQFDIAQPVGACKEAWLTCERA